eukprot:8040234-Pyramimonas_sp.AAC.2
MRRTIRIIRRTIRLPPQRGGDCEPADPPAQLQAGRGLLGAEALRGGGVSRVPAVRAGGAAAPLGPPRGHPPRPRALHQAGAAPARHNTLLVVRTNNDCRGRCEETLASASRTSPSRCGARLA